MAKSIGQYTIRDENDISIGTTAPTGSVKDQMWLDTSKNPSVLKRYNGSSWDVVNDYSGVIEDVEEKIQANTTAITVAQGQISGLISESSIIKGDVTTLKDNYTTIDATVNGLKATVSSHTTSITNAQNTANNANTLADSKAKVFTSTPTTPYKIGDLWVQGTSGDVMRCKVARATGSYVATDWEKASKYTDDTKANAVEVKLNNLSGKVTTVETKQATLEQNIEGFKTTVSSTYSTKTELNTLNDTVTVVEQRVNTVEQNITATAITTTISSAINAGTSSITTTQFIMDKNGLAIKNGALTIKNKAGATVLTADTDGNLFVQNTLAVGGNTNGNIQVKNASNANIFTVSKNGVFLKDGTMKVTSGNVNWNGITYPEGNTRDMTIYAYGTSIEEKDYSGSQVYKRLSEYFGGHIKLVEDNRENAEQTYYETRITARGITINNGVSLKNGQNNSLLIQTPSGAVAIGANNPTYCHFYTDRDQYYFDKSIYVEGRLNFYASPGSATRIEPKSTGEMMLYTTSRSRFELGTDGRLYWYKGSTGAWYLIAGSSYGD